MPNFNKKIDQLIVAGEMAIDKQYALSQLGIYLEDLDRLESGIPYTELGISQRREAQSPKLLSFENCNTVEAALTPENLDRAPGQIAKLKLSGVMRLEGGLSSRGINALCNDIAMCDAHPNVDAIILEVNSGGGESLAGQALYNAVKDSSTPIIAFAHFMGSAAVMGTLPAAKIIAAGQFSEIGSIGVLVSIHKGMAEYYAENYEDIYSQKSPEKNQEWREYLKGNKGPIIEALDKHATAFHKAVQKHRNLSESSAESTLKGAMFIAADARRRGLIDEIGTFNQAVEAAKKEARRQQRQNTGKMKLLEVVNKFLGIDAATEEEAAEKLASHQAEGESLGTQMDALDAKLTTYEAKVDALTQSVEALNADLKARAEGEQVETLTAEQVQTTIKEQVEASITALKAEVGGEIAKIKAGKSGGEADVDPNLNIPAGGKKDEDEPEKVNLTARMKEVRGKIKLAPIG